MEIVVVVRYKGGNATYKIRPEVSGIYHADLMHFDQPGNSALPQTVTLIRSVRSWKGSTDDQELLNQLGAALNAGKKKKRGKAKEENDAVDETKIL
jgi:hypothetical protein